MRAALRPRYGAQLEDAPERLPDTRYGRQPVPLSETVRGLLAELLVTTNELTRSPNPSGRNATRAKQLARGSRVAPQLFPAMMKSTDDVARDNVAATPPMLVMVIACGEVEEPMMRSPNPIETGDTTISGAAIAWPVA